MALVRDSQITYLGHSDLMGDAVEVLEASGALAVGMLEVCDGLGTQGIQNTSPFNVGGTQEVEGIAVTAVRADHTSSIQDGDHCTMGLRQAAYAIRLLGATLFVPMHVATFPVLTGTPEDLRSETADVEALEIVVMEPGETLR